MTTLMIEHFDLTTPEAVAAYMRAAASEDDWNARADAVKAAWGGRYPAWWDDVTLPPAPAVEPPDVTESTITFHPSPFTQVYDPPIDLVAMHTRPCQILTDANLPHDGCPCGCHITAAP